MVAIPWWLVAATGTGATAVGLVAAWLPVRVVARTDFGSATEPQCDAIRLTRVGFVFRRGLLLERPIAHQNVTLVQTAAGRPRREARARTDVLLDRLELAGRAHLHPGAPPSWS